MSGFLNLPNGVGTQMMIASHLFTFENSEVTVNKPDSIAFSKSSSSISGM
jgi:hypothetical protein